MIYIMKHIPYDNPIPEGYEELKIGNIMIWTI